MQLSDDQPPTLHLTFVRDFVPKAWFLRQNKVRLEPLVLPCGVERYFGGFFHFLFFFTPVVVFDRLRLTNDRGQESV